MKNVDHIAEMIQVLICAVRLHLYLQTVNRASMYEPDAAY
jgi:hypothetical protein